ncbi:carboxypeptidase-like regulatory domain-containing protein [Bremerella sp. JC770]|uniref:carboxypeptidase-like regulatory domain-containing protein n=1 Tax=Bremerella sp. JC770 TaxID=3232137 RepID=UPI003457FBFF
MKGRFLGTIILSFFALVGCQNGDTEGVTGTVKLDGAPLANAEVVFTPEGGGRPASAKTDEQGNYQLRYTVDQPGAPAGTYIVEIRTGTSKTGPDGKDLQVPELVPTKYNNKTELTAEVTDGGNNRFDFDMKSS